MKKHRDFGKKLSEYRVRKVLTQHDLAHRLGVTQQTISYWEEGMSRPSVTNILQIAELFEINYNKLLIAVGYTPKPETIATFDKPFPLNSIAPTSFERFCNEFLNYLYPDADVHRYGDKGDKQGGVDIEAVFKDGKTYTFQCKRHNTFGAKKVNNAIKEHIKKSDKKVILLSRPASTLARDEIKKHSCWELWDVEDISRLIRQKLSLRQRRSLVDTFFKGQRLALLGTNEAGPWQEPEDFFAPYLLNDSVLPHTFDLIGHTKELETFKQFLYSPNKKVALFYGNAGSGKSRLLCEISLNSDINIPIYFLSPTDSLTQESFDSLGDSSVLLICDDAHDRQDLSALFKYIATNKDAKLLLALRSYKLDFIKRETLNNFWEEKIQEIQLERMHQNEIIILTSIIIKKFGGNKEHAEKIARFTGDCLLATVIAAKLVAINKLDISFLQNNEQIKSLFKKLRDELVGGIGSGIDKIAIEDALNVIALIQPINIEDEITIKAISNITSLKIYHINKILKLLFDSGILLKRGCRYRITPDLLADFIIEENSVCDNGISTGYAEEVFIQTPKQYVGNFLVNLGRLDWRIRKGNTNQSKLLSNIWDNLLQMKEYPNSYINAVVATAYYQPEQALMFAEALINGLLRKTKSIIPDLIWDAKRLNKCNQKTWINKDFQKKESIMDITNIIKNAAYSYDVLPKACELLWEMMRNNDKDGYPLSRYGINTLRELATPTCNKSYPFLKRVVDFILSRFLYDNKWKNNFTPLDVLDGIFNTQGESYVNNYNNKSIEISPYLISPKTMTPIREQIIDKCLELLIGPRTELALKAAKLLEQALNYPMHAEDKIRNTWTVAFIQTLKKIEKTIEEHKVSPIIRIVLADSVSWHAQFSTEELSAYAKKIMRFPKDDFLFEITLALLDGARYIYNGNDFLEKHLECDNKIRKTSEKLLNRYQDKMELVRFIEEKIIKIEEAQVLPLPQNLITQLARKSEEFSENIILNAILHPESPTAKFVGISLGQLLSENRKLATHYIRKIFSTKNVNLIDAIGYGYGVYQPNERYVEEDLKTLRQIIYFSNDKVLTGVTSAIYTITRVDKMLAIRLISKSNFSNSSAIANNYLMCLAREPMTFELINTKQIEKIFESLIKLSTIEDYWIQTFLILALKKFTKETLVFFIKRIEYDITRKSEDSYCPIPHYFPNQVSFNLFENKCFETWLQFLFDWALQFSNTLSESNNYTFLRNFGQCIRLLCSPYNDNFTCFMKNWCSAGTIENLKLMIPVLKDAQPNFVFEQNQFVSWLLNYTNNFSKDIYSETVSSLQLSTLNMVKSGSLGQPFPEDVRMKEMARKEIGLLSPFHPAHRLYESILNHAKNNISISLQEDYEFI